MEDILSEHDFGLNRLIEMFDASERGQLFCAILPLRFSISAFGTLILKRRKIFLNGRKEVPDYGKYDTAP